jgi:formyl-CoA transferase
LWVKVRNVSEQRDGVLADFRVIELGSYVAAPTAGRLLAAFGADVVKVERPGKGDESRQWHTFGEETSLLWRSLGRGKRSVTIDLRTEAGRDLVLGLVARSDVVLDGFRPGTLERLGLGPAPLAASNPDVILVRLSGFGQDGPYRDRAGFGSVAEAMGGLRFLTGYPDRPPSRMGVSLGDSVAGLYAALGAVLALLERERGKRAAGDGEGRSAGTADGPPAETRGGPPAETRGGPPAETRGGLPAETVDVALCEAVYSLLDSVVAEYDAFGVVRQRTGPTIAGVVPSNAYQCADGGYVVIGANADAIFVRLAKAIGRPELGTDPRYAGALARAKAGEELDAVISAWTHRHTQAEVMATMADAGVPASPVYDAADLAADPHFAARGAHQWHKVSVNGQPVPVRFPAPVPRLARSRTPARWAGPDLGEHTRQVLTEVLELTGEELRRLTASGVI